MPSSIHTMYMYVCSFGLTVTLHYISLTDEEFPLLLDGVESKSRPLPEGIYNVPRSLFLDEALYDEPPTELILASTDPSLAPPARGLYDVPRALLGMKVYMYMYMYMYMYVICIYFSGLYYTQALTCTCI